MSYTIKPFEELDIMDDFLISAAACDEEVGEEFSRTLINGLLQRNLGNIQVGIQKVIFPNTPNQRGIRLDIEVNEYDIINEEIHMKKLTVIIQKYILILSRLTFSELTFKRFTKTSQIE